MIVMPQIFDVTANKNARYKLNELELYFALPLFPGHIPVTENVNLKQYWLSMEYIFWNNRIIFLS